MAIAFKTAVREMWAAGDYHRFARSTVWQLGPVLIDACGIDAGQRVLDVAAGTGNVAIRAARAGAVVTASDLTPAHFDAGRRAARAEGVDVEWVEADAESLPFPDAAFDAVTSCFGAMFAPDHRRVAGELLRVCRPGGVIGLINFTPEGAGGDFFRLLSPYVPPPPVGAQPPLSWGSEEHVRELFTGSVASLDLHRREYVETASSAREYHELFKQSFGPMVAIYTSLADDPARASALDRGFADFITRWNRGRAAGRVAIPYEYLLVVARRAGS